MSEAHPMWSRIKQGMLLGGILGLHLGFLFALDWMDIRSYHGIFDTMLIGGGAGFMTGGAAALIWLKLQAPFKRLEADLQSAAALRAKELINEQDFQALKARILANYQPTSSGVRPVLTAAVWMALIGATIALGVATAQFGGDLYSNDVISQAILPTIGGGIALGTAIAAIIQSALDGGKRRVATGKSVQAAMLNEGGFDPLGQIQSQPDRIPAKR
jgi:hypothetical protein